MFIQKIRTMDWCVFVCVCLQETGRDSDSGTVKVITYITEGC